MGKIWIPKNMLNYSDAEFAVIVGSLIGSGSWSVKYNRYSICSATNIGFALLGDRPPASLLNTIKTGINQLLKQGAISEVLRGYYTFNNAGNFDVKTDRFVVVEVETIRKIMHMRIKGIRNVSLLRYLVTFLGMFDNKKGICYMPFSYISKKTDKCPSTIIKYNKILNEENLINTFSRTTTDCQTGKITKHNVYFLPGKYENAKSYAAERGWLDNGNNLS